MKRLLTIMLALTMFSCDNTPEPTPAGGLSLSRDEVTVAHDERRTSVTVRSNVDWTLSVTEGADWITPGLDHGAAGSTIEIDFTLATNTGDRQRRGTVAIEGEGGRHIFTIIQNPENTLSGVNKWIYETMTRAYYWNDVVKDTPPPPNDLPYDEFLKTLIQDLEWARVQDTSNGENPATIDGDWTAAFLASGQRRSTDENDRENIYSYIERTPTNAPATRAFGSRMTIFGFGFEQFWVDDNGLREFLVTYVQPGTPADEAGMKRGMWITQYNGADIYYDQYYEFFYRLHYLEGGNTLSFSDASGKPYFLTAADSPNNPILHHSVITTAKGTKVGYLVYNEFYPGDSNEFDDQLRDIFGEFLNAGATELVLDLRYNRGGRVSSARVLASLAGDVRSTQVFEKNLFNPEYARENGRENPQSTYFYNEPNSIGLRKIYLLATNGSASASESIISSLRGVDIEVVHIGDTTSGKNVGMSTFSATFDGYSYNLLPITFKGLDANDFTDYAGGFRPTVYRNEFYNMMYGLDYVHNFGDPKEYLLEGALTMIDGGTLTPDPTTRLAPSGTRKLMPAPRDPRHGLRIYTHEEER
ncbi:MAG: hypothetical protein LBV38_02955 [Alistipes sp.]|jgi:hypothetical protein|nr:hypothetical protein [Alistipes sp.]